MYVSLLSLTHCCCSHSFQDPRLSLTLASCLPYQIVVLVNFNNVGTHHILCVVLFCMLALLVSLVSGTQLMPTWIVFSIRSALVYWLDSLTCKTTLLVSAYFCK